MATFNGVVGIPSIGTIIRRACRVDDDRLRAFGLDFPSPLGLAAGFDKNARWFNALAMLGFGFIEVGTITGQPQPGNPKPRLFRLPDDRALINRFGFKSDGSRAVAEQLSRQAIGPMLGINIGKSKIVPNEQAAGDYQLSFERLFPYADYFVINVSSPNTPGLRALQQLDSLSNLCWARWRS